MNTRFFNMGPELQKKVAVFVPIIALLLSVFVVYPAWGNYQLLKEKVDGQRLEYTTLKNLPLPKPNPKQPTAVMEPSEPPKSIGEISKIAESAGCKVTGFDIGTVAAAKAAADDKQGGIVRAKRSRINLEAHYQQIREFLAQLSHAERVFVITELNLTAQVVVPGSTLRPSPGTLEANVEIERYVTVPSAPVAAPAAEVKK